MLTVSFYASTIWLLIFIGHLFTLVKEDHAYCTHSPAQYQQFFIVSQSKLQLCTNTDSGSYVITLLPHSFPTSIRVAYPKIVPECSSSVMQCPMLYKRQIFNMPLDQSLGVEAHRTVLGIKLNKYAQCKKKKHLRHTQNAGEKQCAG